MPRTNAKKQIVGTKRPARPPAPLPVEPAPPTPPFPLTGPMTHAEFHACWDLLTARGKARVRAQADAHDLTLKAVLARWPVYRVG